ncbi:ABC transporter ATP-binding protein [Pyramidobacter sp. SM-530-WT-4B]|uniref:ABC transporter ATP-binding protein n=1 Tax=Pyramidobacter porci TaxID=2605789 RepID=A0A6L5Y9B3_9BACT|nr:ABC transporter ATP-binding protein [Pyramidobacter porci]MST54783.1 ABC transporter ATP-binding protein [Pyramidobacter porci]
MLEVKGLTKKFGGLTALNDVNMSVADGAIHGLIGPNGSGKTTLINVISGFCAPTSGSITMAGREISSLTPYAISRLGMVRTFQNINIFPEMTVLQNSLMGNFMHEQPNLGSVIVGSKGYRAQVKRSMELAEEMLNFVGLAEVRNKQAGTMPYGRQRKLEIARALMTRPKLLVLDEPVAGMNEQESDAVADLLLKLQAKRNITIILIEHDMRFVMKLCSLITVLSAGKVIAAGISTEIQNNAEVISVYLGTGRKKHARN